MPHGRQICAKTSDMEMAKMCAYPHYDYSLLHWKFVSRCCAKCPCINLHDQETDNQYSDTSSSIRLFIYYIVVICTSHDRILLKYKRICHMRKQ